MRPIKLNLGSGYDEREGWDNIDKKAFSGKTIVVDLEKELLPYEEGGVDFILASHVLEHLGDGLFYLMNECWHVLRPEGRMEVRVPKFPHEDAIKDPTHKRFFVQETFQYFANEKTCNMYGWKRWNILSSEIVKKREIRVIMSPLK